MQRRIVLGAFFLAWLAVVVATVWRHEFFRDEIRAFSIAIAAPSFFDLPQFLKNEGHPLLWYALLRAAHQIIPRNYALPITSIFVAAAAVWIFLFRAPFSVGLKLLFTFSILPLYEYSVIARNYGISMLLMFGFAALYRERRRHPLVLTSILALLANSNIHSLLLAGLLTAVWLWDGFVVDRRNASRKDLTMLALGAGLLLIAAFISVRTVLPDESTIATSIHRQASATYFLNAFVNAVTHPWHVMAALLPVPGEGLAWHFRQVFLFAVLMAGLCIRVPLMLAMVVASLSLSFLFSAIYPGHFPAALQHHGLLLVFLIVLYWLCADSRLAAAATTSARLNTVALLVALPIVFFWDDYLALRSVGRDFVSECSSTKRLGDWLKSHSEARDAIVLAEPDYLIEPLPYYTKQRIFIPRESRFGNWVHLTNESKAVMTIGELLQTAQELKAREHQSVFITLGFPATEFAQRRLETYSFNKVLVWTPSEWQQFEQGTTRVSEFWSAKSDENFDLYEVR